MIYGDSQFWSVVVKSSTREECTVLHKSITCFFRCSMESQAQRRGTHFIPSGLNWRIFKLRNSYWFPPQVGECILQPNIRPSASARAYVITSVLYKFCDSLPILSSVDGSKSETALYKSSTISIHLHLQYDNASSIAQLNLLWYFGTQQ